MTNTCKYCGGLIDQSASFCDSRCKDLFSKYTPICKQCAAKDADIEKLKEKWNEYDQLIKDYAYQSKEIERLKVEIKRIGLTLCDDCGSIWKSTGERCPECFPIY